MDNSGKRWTTHDSDGHPVYLTEERWQHIIDAENHPEMMDYEEHLKLTIQHGRRRQEALNPRKYRYAHYFDDLPEETNHVVAIVLFSFDIDEHGITSPNNFITTAFFKHIRFKGGRA